MSKINEILTDVDKLIIYNKFDPPMLNLTTKKLIRILPFYKILDIPLITVKKIICFLLDNYMDLNDENKEHLDLFLIDFGWISHKRNENVQNNSLVSNVLHMVLKHNNIYLTIEQFELYEKIKIFLLEEKEKTFFVSAPTSFGKTSIIIDTLEYLILKSKNVLFILPNKNLINETSIKVKNKYGNRPGINISSSVLSFLENYNKKNSNIFIGTAERYFGINQINNLVQFDLLIVDEAQKVVDYIDSRSRYLSLTIKKHINRSKVIFLTPNVSIESITSRLKNLDINYESNDKSLFKSEIVSYHNMIVKLHDDGSLGYSVINEQSHKKIEIYKKHINIDENKSIDKVVLSNLFDAFPYTREKSIVYITSPKKAFELAKEISDEFSYRELSSEPVVAYHNYLDKNFPNSYYLKELLNYGIVMNIGPMDDISKKMSVESFVNSEEINIIIANGTINEGVNLYAKNLILFSQTIIGNVEDAEITQRNLLGRVGRFNQFFVGNRIIIDYKKNDNIIVKRLIKSIDSEPVKLL